MSFLRSAAKINFLPRLLSSSSIFSGIYSMSSPTILFIHRNFPGQFRSLAPYLVKKGWNVLAAGGRPEHDRFDCSKNADGIHIFGYRPRREPTKDTHTYLRNMDIAVLDGQGFARTGLKMKEQGIEPDIIVAHSGWGSGSFARAVWPNAKFVQYLEWWYSYPARDVDPQPLGNIGEQAEGRAKTLSRNLPILLDAVQADAIICPSAFQAADVPDMLKSNITIMPDGVDCSRFHPQDNDGELELNGLRIPSGQKIVTYATRGMEPQRGFPEFMAAWAEAQHKLPDTHCVIAGEDKVFYGAKLPEGQSFLKRAMETYEYDQSRIHTVGRLDLDTYASLLRRTNCHAYLTKPFVVSWSLMEAMASGAPLVVSDVDPVRETLSGGNQAFFVDHGDISALARAIVETVKDPNMAKRRGQNARRQVEARFEAQKCLGDFEAMFTQLIGQRRAA